MSDVRASRTRRQDPLGVSIDLSFSGTHYPYGFRLDLSTNSRDVLEAAEESWGGQRREFDAPPMTMRVVVRPEGDLSQPASHRKQGHLFCVVSDRDNFAHIDLQALFASIHVSQKTASDHSWLRWYFVESQAYLMLCQRQIVLLHAGFVARNGSGVMLCGASAAGKSTLAYACARSGWTFLSDDTTALLTDSPGLLALGRPRQVRFRPDAPLHFPEIEQWAARARPTGKIAIEAPTAALPITTADRATVGGIAFLERGGGPSARQISGEEAVDRLLGDLPSFGADVDDLHERVVSRLAIVPAHVLHYDTIEQGVTLLSAL